mgnify:CR=1 FL=1
MAAIGFLILMVIKARNVPGGMILAIVLTTIVGIPFGVTHAPEQIFSLPAGIGKQFMNIDFLGALNFAYIPFLIALFVPDFFSTFGTVLGVGAKAGYLDKDAICRVLINVLKWMLFPQVLEHCSVCRA